MYTSCVHFLVSRYPTPVPVSEIIEKLESINLHRKMKVMEPVEKFPETRPDLFARAGDNRLCLSHEILYKIRSLPSQRDRETDSSTRNCESSSSINESGPSDVLILSGTASTSFDISSRIEHPLLVCFRRFCFEIMTEKVRMGSERRSKSRNRFVC